MGASIFDLMHYNSNGNSDAHGHRVGGQASRQSREVPRASSINANSGSSGSAISYPAAVASPPRAYSPPTKQVNNYTTSTAVAGEAGAASKPLTRGAFFAESFITGMPPAPAVTAGTTSRAGAGGGSMSSSRPVLSTSPPRSPKSLCRVQPAPPRSPPTFLTAGRESSSDGENDDEEEEEVVLQHQQLPQYYQQYPQQEDRPAPSSHMRVGSDFRRGPASRQSLLSGQQSQEEFRHSIEVDILSKYEQTRRELKDAFRQPGAAERDLSLGSNDSPASHESEVDSERNPNEGQVGDYYYYDQGGGEDEEEEDGSSFDAEGYAEDAVDEAEFINDSSSDGSY